MKIAYAVIEPYGQDYRVQIEVTNGDLTSGADG